MPNTTFELGDTIKHNGGVWRVVRIIRDSTSLIQPEDLVPYVLRESYVELRGPIGEPEFLILSSEIEPYNGKASPIKGLAPIPTKGENNG